MHWQDMERVLVSEDRCILPLGCTEQHAYLSLATDTILATRIATEAAEPLGVPVFPTLPYGLTISRVAYAGTITLSYDTFGRILKDLLCGVYNHGFRRILIVNGHGGNNAARSAATEWLLRNRDAKVKWHDWWTAPLASAKIKQIDQHASHASWMENFPWTRLEGVESPDIAKAMHSSADARTLDPQEWKNIFGDGNHGGLYSRSDDEMLEIWSVVVSEARGLLESGW